MPWAVISLPSDPPHPSSRDGIKSGSSLLLGWRLLAGIDPCLGQSPPPVLKSYMTRLGNPRDASCSQAMGVSGSLASQSR